MPPRLQDVLSYRRDRDCTWLGFVRWSEGVGLTRIAWLGEEQITSIQAVSALAKPPDDPTPRQPHSRLPVLVSWSACDRSADHLVAGDEVTPISWLDVDA